jgi:PAS domain S-box-containing protein
VIEVNDAWTRDSGFDRAESLGAVAPYPWWPDPEDHPATARVFEGMVEQIRDGTSGEWEVMFRHRDGHLFPVIISVAVLRDAQGDLSMAIGTVKDITDRKATEDALRTERDHRQAIVAALQEGLCVTDSQGTVLDVNAGWTQITGFSFEASVGARAPYPWWPTEPLERELLARTLARAIEQREYGDIEATIVRADGVRRQVVLNIHPLPEIENVVPGFVTTMRDITRRKAAEAQLRLLADLATELSSMNEPEEVGRAALALLMPEVDADLGALLQVETDDDVLRIVTTVGTNPDIVERFREIPLDLPSPATDAVRLRELVVVVDDDAGAYPTLEEFRSGHALESNVDVPLCKGDAVVGVLMLGFRRPYRPSPETEELLHAAAPIVAQALDRARLFAFERSVAVTLQEAMLAPYPIVAKEFAVAARYEPAVAMLEVGGDWYDVITLEDGRLAVAVGDTVGRGLNAAAVMGQLRSALHAIAHTTVHSSEAVSALDRFALEIPGAKAATLVYAIVDPTTRSVTYTSAGHPPPLVIEPDGRTRFLEEARSWPLAVTSTAKARVEAVDTLTPGSTLLCYTDGLIERRGEHLGTGLDRLACEASQLADAPVEDLCDELLAVLVGHGEHDDDVGLVALRVATLDTPAFTCRIPADSSELATVRRILRGWLDRQNVSTPTQDDILLAVGEACTNAIEHAYRDDRAIGIVVVEGRRGDDDVVLTVRDHGVWRPRPPDPSRNRGLKLIDEVMDDVVVSSVADGGTRVRMRRRVADRQATPT